MLKIAASVASGALAVAGAGYSYVNRVQSDADALKTQNVTLQQTNVVLQQKNDAQAAKINGMGLAIDNAIRQLQIVRANGA